MVASWTSAIAQTSTENMEPAHTEVPSVHDNERSPIVEAVAEYENVSYSEALRILDKQHHSLEIMDRVEQLAGSSFAGAWMSGEYDAVIAANDTRVAENLKNQFGLDENQVNTVNYSYSDLDKAYNIVSNRLTADRFTIGTVVGLNEEKNRIEVTIPNESASLKIASLKQFDKTDLNTNFGDQLFNPTVDESLESAENIQSDISAFLKFDDDIIDIKVSDEPNVYKSANSCNSRSDCFPDFRGGLQIKNTPRGNTCTAGFNAKRGSTHYIITAGHCGNKGDRFHQIGGNRHLGYIDRSYIDSRDAARLKVEGPWRNSWWVYAKDAWKSLSIVQRANYNHSRDSLACASGVVSDFRCGRILSTRETVLINWKWRHNFWTADFGLVPGESGAPIFLPGSSTKPNNVLAYGILSGYIPFPGSRRNAGPNIIDVEGQLHVRVTTN